MKTTEKGIELIKRFERFYAVPYYCPAGYLTVGYGHVLMKGEKFEYPITEEQAEELLLKDIAIFEKAVMRLIISPLTEGMFDALVSFSYNLGSGALQRSTLRQKLNRHEYIDAADEFLKWIWAGGRKLKGLILRRQAERERFLEEGIP